MVLCFVFIYGCSSSDNPYDNLDYRSGTQGLEVVFAADTPPSKVYAGSYLNMVLEVKNKGAFDIENGNAMVYLTGFDPTAIKLQGYDTKNKYKKIMVPPTTGKNAYIPEGGYNVIDVKESDKVSVPFGESYKPKLMATTCYKYYTLATPTVCVVSNPESILKENICKPDSITMSSQGGPVAVTKVEEEVMQQMLNFIITVENVGNGKVIDQNRLNNCPFNLGHTDLNLVDVDVSMSGGGEVECTPADKRIRLVNGKGVIFCKIPIEMETSYTTPLLITLNYGYSSSVIRDVEIINAPGAGSSYSGSNPGVIDPNNPNSGTPDNTNLNTNDPYDNYPDNSDLIYVASTNNDPIKDNGNDLHSDSSTNNVKDDNSVEIIPDSICKCGATSDYPNPEDPCVCLYYNGRNVFCNRNDLADIAVFETNPKFTVRGSDSQITNCGIDGTGMTCGQETEITLNLQNAQIREISVWGSGTKSAQQPCKIQYDGGVAP